jgi:hypothetical protein
MQQFFSLLYFLSLLYFTDAKIFQFIIPFKFIILYSTAVYTKGLLYCKVHTGCLSKQNSVQSNKCFHSVQQARVGGPGHSTHSLLPPSSFYVSCTNRPFRLVIRTASQLLRNRIRLHQVPVLPIFALTSLTNFHHLTLILLMWRKG